LNKTARDFTSELSKQTRNKPRTHTPQTLWTMAREKTDLTIVVMKNENYAILNIELARVREGEPNEKMLSMIHLNNSTKNPTLGRRRME
jgi:hypothetical protein